MSKKYIILSILIVILFSANIFFGSVKIPAEEIINVLVGNQASKMSWEFIILHSRIPQAVTALLCGASIAVSGLLLQTAFANPLAGPSVLGINSGANLGAAIVMLAGGSSIVSGAFSISGFFAVVVGAFAGAMATLGIILLLSAHIKSNVMLLIAGIMIGYVTSSAISLLNFFATAEGVHSFIIWGMGNFGGVSLEQLPWFSAICLLGLVLSILMIKPLNALLLGDLYAENLGINIRRVRNILLLTTGLLTAITTAFCGPIAFLGLAVPHIARLILKSENHRSLLPVTILCGIIVSLVCNILCVLPGENGIIPLNAVTPLLGAPVILYILLKKNSFT